jgi:thiamine biosynthesis lipoprotein ApbE/Na+-translocating ferredoxin:NAD+ oxidoreductase RnfG subunit
MIMKLISMFFTLAVFLGSQSAFSEDYISENDALKLAFSGLSKPIKKYRALSEKTKSELKKFLPSADIPASSSYWVSKKSGQASGYAVIDNVIGKHRPITYIVALDENLKIKFIEVMSYRESRGGEVRGETWRSQFIGKSESDILRVGTTINNISGATLSCRSLTRDIKKNLTILDGIRKKNSIDSMKPAPTPSENKSSSLDLRFSKRIRYAMGTSLEIIIPRKSNSMELISKVHEELFTEASRLNKIFSTYDHSSELSVLNSSTGGEFKVSKDLGHVIALGLQINSQASEFNPAIGPLLKIWKTSTPNNYKIKQALALIDLKTLQINSGVVKKTSDLKLDFGALAKGYYLEKAKSIILKNNVRRAFINFGGQILAVGGGWKAAISAMTVVEIDLDNESISTSSMNQKKNHIINPSTGYPAKGFRSLSVIHKNAALADAYSTAIFTMPPARALKFAESHQIKMIALTSNQELVYSKNMRRYAITKGTL